MRVSRRTLARYAAERVLAGDASVVDELAALLVSEGRQRELELLVRDIESALAERGTVVASVESAKPLEGATRRAVEQLLSDAVAQQQPTSGTTEARRRVTVKLRERVDPSLIGGVKITTPTQVMDATIRKKLHTLRAKKI